MFLSAKLLTANYDIRSTNKAGSMISLNDHNDIMITICSVHDPVRYVVI